MTTREVIADRFELLEPVARGGMGEIWKALDRTTGAIVALKRLLRGDRGQARFLREARVLASFSHPAIVPHVADGVDHGQPYLAMAWIEGETLARRLADAPLTLAETLALGKRLASALSTLHAVGVVHRDLKPLNVMLRSRRAQDPVLLDLGVAKGGPELSALTDTRLVLGTFGYMAPEQALSSRAVDPRADLFSLGCVLFECAGGQAPFAGDHVVAVLSGLLLGSPRRLGELRPELPARFEALVMSMLARDPGERPPDADAVLRALDEIVDLGVALEQSTPRLARTLSDAEQRFVVAALIEIDRATADAVTIEARAAASSHEDVRRVARSLGGEVVILGPLTALFLIDARGTAADRAYVSASAMRALLDALPRASGGIATGFTSSSFDTPAGELLDRAALLAQSAVPGIVQVDAATAELLRDRYHLDGGPRAFRLGAVRSPEGERCVLGRVAPFVGRDKELALLEATVAEAIDEGVARGVLVIAPTGAGKSRLARELVARVRRRQDMRVFEARTDATTAGAVHVVIRRLIRSAVGLGPVADIGDGDRLRAHVRSLPGLEHAERVANFLCELIGGVAEPCAELVTARHDAELMVRWIRKTVIEWLDAECRRSPVALVVEDLQWADEATIDHLGGLLRALERRPLVVVALARPDIHERMRQPWPGTLELKLGPLSPRPAERFVRALLDGRGSDSQVTQIVARAAGSPLFLEELVRFVVEERGEVLPTSIAAVLHARLEALPAFERRVLRAASVLGERFSTGGVAAIIGEDAQIVGRSLSGLAREETVQHEGDDEWVFHHALVRDAAYAMLSPDDVRTGHRRAADWLESLPDPEPRELLMHLEQAGEHERAVPWLFAAARRAWEAGAEREMFTLAERGLSRALPRELEGELRVLVSAARVWRGEMIEGVSEALRALELLGPSHPVAFQAAGTAAYLAAVTGDRKRALAVIDRLCGVALPPGRSGGIALLCAVTALGLLGERDAALRLGALADGPADPAAEVWLRLTRAALSLTFHGRVGEAQRSAAEAAALARRVGDLSAASLAEVDAHLFAVSCRSEHVLARLRALAAAHADSPMPNALFWLQLEACCVERWLTGESSGLLEIATQRDISRAEQARMVLISADLEEGHLDRADAELRRAPFVSARCRPTVLEARLALARGSPDVALARVDRAEEEARRVGWAWSWEWIQLTRVQALVALGQDDLARAAARNARSRLAMTLDGADADFLAIAEDCVIPIVKLRAVAKRLGIE